MKESERGKAEMKKYISIDIGGTAIKYGIVSEDAEVLLKKEMKTEAQKGGPAILDKVIGIVEALKEEESDLKEDLSEELTLDNYNDILDKLDSDEEYVDAFDNIVYFDELGVENDTELEELTEEIYPGIRKMKK